jgi:NADPH:quinone reductase
VLKRHHHCENNELSELSVLRYKEEVYAFAKTLMPHAIQIRQTGGPEVLKWTPSRPGRKGSGCGAGTVEAIGQDVRAVKVGDRVAYAGPAGGYSEVRLIDADRLVRLPDAISFDQAAAMMFQGMTAQVLIRPVYPVKAGDLILVRATSGSTVLTI